MPKFMVLFDIRHFNGAIEVEAESEERAREIVENDIDMDVLRNNCDSTALEVEEVELVPTKTG